MESTLRGGTVRPTSGGGSRRSRRQELPVVTQIHLDIVSEELSRIFRPMPVERYEEQGLVCSIQGCSRWVSTVGLLALAVAAVYIVMGELGLVNAMSIFGG